VDNAFSQGLNQAMDQAAAPYGVQIADGYGAFQNAALNSGGHTCTAGLLTQLNTPPGGCGVHPSVAGQSVLALAQDGQAGLQAVDQVVAKKPGR
jgi:hypothetical protein